MKEAIVTALTPVDIRDLSLTLARNQAVFLKNIEYAKSTDLQNLVRLGAVKVEWVERDRVRKIPDMRTYREPTAIASSSTNAQPPVVRGSDRLEEIDQKLDRYTQRVEESFSHLSHLAEMREILRETVLAQERLAAQLMQAVQVNQANQAVQVVQTQAPLSQPSQDPVFIPSKILDNSLVSTLSVDQATSEVDIDDAASSLRKAKGRAKT
jgi:hypothetical protein